VAESLKRVSEFPSPHNIVKAQTQRSRRNECASPLVVTETERTTVDRQTKAKRTFSESAQNVPELISFCCQIPQCRAKRALALRPQKR
jgi:hypothetical protein